MSKWHTQKGAELEVQVARADPDWRAVGCEHRETLLLVFKPN